MAKTEQTVVQKHLADDRLGKLLEAVLVAPNLHQAAKLAGVPWSTARRLAATSEFQLELARARQQAFELTVARFKGLADRVVNLIEQAINRGDMRVTMWAWDRMLNIRDIDLEARVRALEERIGS